MWYVWDTNILQGQHYNQANSHETQGPGSQGQEEWGYIQLQV